MKSGGWRAGLEIGRMELERPRFRPRLLGRMAGSVRPWRGRWRLPARVCCS